MMAGMGGRTMNETLLRKYLGAGQVLTLHCYEQAESTNLLAKQWAREAGSLPAVFVADRQTEGRGRMGRSFESPQGGLYMSIALDCKGLHPGVLTTLAAAAVLEAGDEMGLPGLSVKWVNDIVQHGKKVGGILAEGLLASEGLVKQLVIGIGLNTSKAVFSPELSDKAACLDTGGQGIERERLAALIVSALLKGLPRVPEHMALYRARCLTIGQDVRFEQGGSLVYGRALGVSDEGALLVRTPQADIELQAGEVSIRGSGGEYV